MSIKIIIPKDSTAEKAFKAYMAEKDAFRKAVQSGQVMNNTTKKPANVVTPV